MTRKNIILAIIILMCISTIAYVDMIVKPAYFIKTLVKAPIFLCVPIVYAKFYKDFNPFSLLKSNLRGLKTGFILGVFIYLVIIATFFIANSMVDLSSIKNSLENNLGINAQNFFVIGAYVSIVNSFLEEWFFRGFVFTEYKKTGRKFAYIASSISFSVYHIAIMEGMFNLFLQILVLLGLFIGGLIFNFLNEQNENIYSSWFCHFFANFAMNTIGFFIFFM